MYRYIKKEPENNFSLRRFLKFLPLLTFIIGLAILFYAGWPLVSYQLEAKTRFQASSLIKPYFSLTHYSSNFVLEVGAKGEDLTQIKNWLPSGQRQSKDGRVDFYSLTIPSLGIFNARVKVDGKDLSNNLIHYGGTAYPGSFGNAVIFGHSTLPPLFDPQNYMTIFSTLPTLDYNDEILVKFDGISYRYCIEEMVEVEPEDISILEQHFDDSYLTLVTCVPPGTYLRRLIVRARLAK